MGSENFFKAISWSWLWKRKLSSQGVESEKQESKYEKNLFIDFKWTKNVIFKSLNLKTNFFSTILIF